MTAIHLFTMLSVLAAVPAAAEPSTSTQAGSVATSVAEVPREEFVPFQRPGWSRARELKGAGGGALPSPLVDASRVPEAFNPLGIGFGPPRVALCFDPKNPPADWIRRVIGSRAALLDRYNVTTSWGRGNITWSLVPDGLNIPAEPNGSDAAGPSTLFATFNSQFGNNQALWIGLLQDCFDRWGELSGITFTRVQSGAGPADAGTSFANSFGSASVGDIRISCRNIDGPGGILAYCYFPNDLSALGGNMVIDSSETWNVAATNYLKLRNTVTHELGHGLGIAHVCPANGTKLMEPFLNLGFDGPQHDDVRGVHQLYGDAYGPNSTHVIAYPGGTLAPGQEYHLGDFGTISPVTSASLLSLEQSNSLDYFAFDLAVPTTVSVRAFPVGTTYDNSTQNSNGSCNSGNIVDSRARGILRAAIWDSTPQVIQVASAPALGLDARLDNVSLPAGRFYVQMGIDGSTPGVQQYVLQVSAGNPPRPINDFCANATTIGVGSLIDDNGGATTDVNVCSPSTGDVWYRFVPACSGTLTVDTCGSALDTVLSVHAACGTASSLACNDNATGGCLGVGDSLVTLPVSGGVAYFIRVAGRTSMPGVFNLNTSFAAAPNDTCAGAATLTLGTTSGSTCGTTIDGVSQCDAIAPGPDVWYRYIAPCSQSITLNTCGSAFDTVLSVYQGACGSLINVNCNDDNSQCGSLSRQSALSFPAVGGQAYLIRVSGFAGQTGSFTLNASAVAPTNDTCATARVVGPGSYTGSTCSAVRDMAGFCAPASASPDVFFSVTLPVTTTLFLDTCGSSFDTVLEIYSGACGNMLGMTCNTNASPAVCGTAGHSRIAFAAQAGVTYIVRLAGENNAAGDYVLNVAYGPLNDRCEFATDVVNNSSTPFSSVNAGGEGATSACGNNGTPDVWFRHFAPCPTTVWYSVCDGSFDTQISLYTGFCGAMTEAGCNNNNSVCGNATGSLVARRGTPSQNVYVRVYSATLGGQGTGTLRVICCTADFNASGAITVQDIFDFLAAYFASDSRADVNFSGAITVQDIFDFLATYFNGCG